MSSDETKRMPIKNLKSEEGAEDLAASPDMEPYLRVMMADMQGLDTSSQIEALTQLPLQKRYVWRVASALKWGFADFDDASVAMDLATMSPEDLGKVKQLLKSRPIQFCMFLKALFGAEEMQRLMVQGIRAARQQG